MAQLRQHIEQLTNLFDIRVSPVGRPNQAFALREADGAADEIAIPPVRSEITYATALHEIGHIKGRYQKNRHTISAAERHCSMNSENPATPTKITRYLADRAKVAPKKLPKN